ncbi:hypothetical protein CspeluHIS016_0604040 [Cutaneotrichosporon spelunceum]|uniref:Ankyrin n=1 Tax=Cutaneotrichosporon spelunceum TaxID=1672016 RepID=A0AAD3TYY4_9TREE|nr:hypothetical protein CspeluHIS016_0604040 [Cutaneotrichosporon spelunceum]
MSAPESDPPQSSAPAGTSLPPEALDLASRLFDLARTGDLALVQYLEAGIPPNLTNAAGDTLLMLAAYHGHADLVKALLGHGADPNVLNEKGQAPIAGAVFKKNDDVVKVLFEAGADVSAGHPNARDCAVMFRREDLTELFNSK